MSNENRMSVWKFEDNELKDSYSRTDFINEFSSDLWEEYRKEVLAEDKSIKIVDLEAENNFIVLSHGYSRDEIISNLFLYLHFFTENRLKNRVNTVLNNKKERTKIVSKIDEYCNNDNYEHILGLYGLRRTGKTIAMFHAIKKLIDKGEKVGYLLLDSNVNMLELTSFIKKQEEKYKIKYWFLDEVTLVPEFIEKGANLYDMAYGNSKMILAGTDSYSFSKASEDSLYDRIDFINTTNIDFKEYYELLPNESYIDFIRFGGTFSPDEFYTQEKVNKYIETSLTENLIHTLNNLYVQHLDEYSQIYGWKENNKINQAIEQVIKNENNELVESILMEEFKSELPLTLKNLKKDHDNSIDLTSIFPKIKISELDKELRKRLKLTDIIKQEDIGNQAVIQLQNFLQAVHVLRIYKRYDGRQRIDAYLMRLSGLRYNQTNELIKTLLDDETFISLNSNQKEALLKKLKETVEGFLIEHNILNTLLDLVENNTKPGEENKLKITQVRKDYIVNNNTQDREIDILIINRETKEMDLYEVKRNTEFKENENFWAKWLINKEFCDDLEEDIMGYKIRNRYLLYLGKNEDRNLNELKEKDEFLKNYTEDLPIIYMRNIEEYLLNITYNTIWKNE